MSGWPIAAPGLEARTQVWNIDLALPPDALARCRAILAPEERARADRFMRAADRDGYTASHAALRLILGRTLARPPQTLAFTAAPGGRPQLDGADLAFNLSHSGSRALVALSREATVGVDVETLRPLPDAVRIARTHFAADETAALARLHGAQLQAAFFGLWTRKEAVVKALGGGLSIPLDGFSVSPPPAPARMLRAPEGTHAWTLHHLEPGPGTVGALAAPAPLTQPALAALPADWTTDLA